MSPDASSLLPTPKHLAIIMDGNGRWAQKRKRPRIMGHRAGASAVGRCIDFCLEKGIEVLTLFAFSSENWSRPPEEVGGLMKLFLKALNREVDNLHKRGIQIRFIGERSQFSPDLLQRMAKTEAVIPDSPKLTLVIAASYGGQQDIVHAARRLTQEVVAGRLSVDEITVEKFSQNVDLHDLPLPDLFIRTGGEYRISNFLLWQLAYTELWFTPILWPELDANTLQEAVNNYQQRERRFGLTSAQVKTKDSQ